MSNGSKCSNSVPHQTPSGANAIMKSKVTPRRKVYSFIHTNNWGPLFSWKVVDYAYGMDEYEAARNFVDQYFGPEIRYEMVSDVLEVAMRKDCNGYYEGPSSNKNVKKDYFIVWVGKFEKKPFLQGIKDSFTQFRKTSYYKAKLWFIKV